MNVLVLVLIVAAALTSLIALAALAAVVWTLLRKNAVRRDQ
ncbi:hypothetical protein [Tessaracoccus aquimaris]|nr:hypothetical protein [Tessaracoccus aquimaris]